MQKSILFFSSTTLVLAACGFRAGDYEPVLQPGAEKTQNWNNDLTLCHREVVGADIGRVGYGGGIDRCMMRAGHAIDLAASAEKFKAMEIERKRRETEKADKLRGY